MAAVLRESQCGFRPRAKGSESRWHRSRRTREFAACIHHRASMQVSGHRGPSPRPRSRRSGIQRLLIARRRRSHRSPRSCRVDKPHSRHSCRGTWHRSPRESRHRHECRNKGNVTAGSRYARQRSTDHGFRSFHADLTAPRVARAEPALRQQTFLLPEKDLQLHPLLIILAITKLLNGDVQDACCTESGPADCR